MKQERVELEVVAEFELDAHGNPKYVEAEGLKHYAIKLRTNQIDTSKVDTVIYKLHPTYYDPERVVVAKPKAKHFEFPEHITSYGDFRIAVSGSGMSGEAWSSKNLSDALAAAYRDASAPSIRVAIDQIKRH